MWIVDRAASWTGSTFSGAAFTAQLLQAAGEAQICMFTTVGS